MRAGHAEREKLRAIRDIGVTRLSLGVENFNDEIIELNNRAHKSKELRRTKEELRRQVILRLDDSRLPVEFGCILTNLALFEGEPRRQILECWRPFGGILREHGIRFRSRPNAFFRVMPDAIINEALLLEGTQPLYGRCNRLTLEDGRVLADVV